MTTNKSARVIAAAAGLAAVLTMASHTGRTNISNLLDAPQKLGDAIVHGTQRYSPISYTIDKTNLLVRDISGYNPDIERIVRKINKFPEGQQVLPYGTTVTKLVENEKGETIGELLAKYDR